MNYLSDTLNFEEREWTSMLHTGVSDLTLTTLAGCAPEKNASTIDELLTKTTESLYESADTRIERLTELIKTVIATFDPIDRADYLWYLKFTVAILLLNDLPVSIYALQGDLLTVCFAPPTTIWDSNPVKIDYFASALYDTIENDKNLIFITNQIENRSTLGLYLSMSMLWKAMYRCVGEEKTICRLYPPSNLIDLTEKISSKKLNEEFDTILNFILLHSKIASLIFHYAQRSPRNNCYEEFFAYDVNLIKVLKEFLENTMTKAETMWRRENDNLNYLTMIEYLQIDISEFDTLYKNLRR